MVEVSAYFDSGSQEIRQSRLKSPLACFGKNAGALIFRLNLAVRNGKKLFSQVYSIILMHQCSSDRNLNDGNQLVFQGAIHGPQKNFFSG